MILTYMGVKTKWRIPATRNRMARRVLEIVKTGSSSQATRRKCVDRSAVKTSAARWW
jgi:hypothetical protein